MRSCNEMPYHIALKMRIYPSHEQKTVIEKNAGAARFVYNRLVALNNERYTLKQDRCGSPYVNGRLSYLNTVLSSTKELINTIPFLDDKDIDSFVPCNAKRFYQSAWNNFKKIPASGKPSYHKKSNHVSYQTNAHYKTDAEGINDGNVRFVWSDRSRTPKFITLPKIGKIRFKASPEMLWRVLNYERYSRIGAVTISRDNCGDYYVSLQISGEYPFVEKLPTANSPVGIDMNLSNFYSDSDGTVIQNPKIRRSLEKKLKKLQRKLSRQMEADIIGYKTVGNKRYPIFKKPLKECANYQKTRIKLARLNRQIERGRTDFINVHAKDVIKNHDIIFTEDLKVKNLLKNHHLAGAISDVSWSGFFTCLSQKANMYGRTYVKVPAKDTTQTCNSCGYIMTGEHHIKLGVDEWKCPNCGTVHIRDINAAHNILHKGMSLIA